MPERYLATIGLKTKNCGPIMTDEPRVVRRIGYAVWRYITNADLTEVEPRYVTENFMRGRDDWSWFKGHKGYASLDECLVDALEMFREDLYVDADPNRVNDKGYHYTNVTRGNYRNAKSVGLLAAVHSIIQSLIQAEALEVGDCILGNYTWFLDVEALDSWVAATLIQLPNYSVDHDASIGR